METNLKRKMDGKTKMEKINSRNECTSFHKTHYFSFLKKEGDSFALTDCYGFITIH